SSSSNKVLTGMDSVSRQKGFQLIITNANQEEEREIENLLTLASQKVDGIIFLAKVVKENHLETIHRLPIPVLVRGHSVNDLHTTIHDDYEAGQKIGRYALNLGHRNFLYVGVPEDDYAVGVERKKGFLDALETEKESFARVIQTSFSMMQAYDQALDFLVDLKETFVVCATDNIALAVLKAAKELGLSVPGDFSLSGFGGYEATSFVSPSITTVAFPFQELGELAVREMEQLILGEEMPLEVVMPNELVINESVEKIND